MLKEQEKCCSLPLFPPWLSPMLIPTFLRFFWNKSPQENLLVYSNNKSFYFSSLILIFLSWLIVLYSVYLIGQCVWFESSIIKVTSTEIKTWGVKDTSSPPALWGKGVNSELGVSALSFSCSKSYCVASMLLHLVPLLPPVWRAWSHPLVFSGSTWASWSQKLRSLQVVDHGSVIPDL